MIVFLLLKKTAPLTCIRKRLPTPGLCYSEASRRALSIEHFRFDLALQLLKLQAFKIKRNADRRFYTPAGFTPHSYSHFISTKVLHSYITLAKRPFKKIGFYLDFEKIAGFSPKIAIFSKSANFSISKKLIVWQKKL